MITHNESFELCFATSSPVRAIATVADVNVGDNETAEPDLVLKLEDNNSVL